MSRVCLLVLIGTLLAAPFARAAAGGGNLAQYPPNEVHLTITTDAEGGPVLSDAEIALTTGTYYRLNIHCPDVQGGDLRGWRVEMAELLRNVHLRVVSVGDIEIHMQGHSFNAIECDEAGSARFSFVPIRPGDFDLYVGNVPLAVGRPMGEGGVQASGKHTFGTFIVR